jgi:phage terminase large subunit GpA-like protein
LTVGYHLSALYAPLGWLSWSRIAALHEQARGTQPAGRVFALKGVERGAALVGLPTAVDVSRGGKRLRRGAKVRAVTTGLAKLELFNHLRLPAPVDGEPYPPGYVHLPRVDAEYLKQLCAEQLVTRRDKRGYARREWQKTRERDEALDCYVYARAAAAILGLDRMNERDWRQRAADLGAQDPAPPAPASAPAEPPPTARADDRQDPRVDRRPRDLWLRDERRAINPYTQRPIGAWLGRR